MSDEKIVILAAKRTPIGKLNGNFVSVPAPELAAAAITGCLNTSTLPPEKINAVNLGCVLSAGQGQAPARQAALGAGLLVSTPCTTINKMCGSGMQSVILSHDTLLAGNGRVIIAGGMENMSRAPYLLMGARHGYRLGHQVIYDHMLYDGLEDAYEKGRHMGYFAEKCAEKYHIDRQSQDEFALSSILKARKAIENGFFKEEIVSVLKIDQDEGPFSINPEKIPHLRPVFKTDGTITAANASALSDGAAVLILATESFAKEAGLTPIATIKGHFTHAQEPAWYATAPIYAISGLLNKIGWTLNEVDLFEINEAFAVVTMVAIQQLKINPAKVNIHGGGCILGHPIGATGARILVTLIHALRRQQLQKGIASLCIGGGEATAVAIEINSYA
jgi:acetyl-CoA C-acetyltransferase